MIVTITLNPAVDISYQLDDFQIDSSNRVDDASKTAGGKGLNVARVVKQLDEPVGASGFLGGSLGGFIRGQLGENGIEDLFVEIDGETRNCIAILHNGKQTEILESGPVISEQEQDNFITTYKKFIRNTDIITLSGSLPKGLDGAFYNQLIAIANENEKRVFLDTSGALLKDVLTSDNKPYLIKPNEDELADLLAESELTDHDIAEALKSSLFAGIEWVVVTLGDRGALVKHGDGLYRAMIPSVSAVNPVGSGDSVIAGFSVGMKRGLDTEELMKFGLTMGVLNAMEEKTGSVNVAKVSEVQGKIEIEKLK